MAEPTTAAVELVDGHRPPARPSDARRRAFRAEVHARRRWGYVFWGAMGLVIAVPELMAAFRPDDVPWPTISGTIGYLEYWHPWVALIVVGAIAWWALHVIEFGPERAPVLRVDSEENPRRLYVNTPGGWSTRAERLRRDVNGYVYMAIASVGVAAPSLFTALAWRPHDEYLLGEVLYGAILVFWILIPIGLAYTGADMPFPTLFETFREIAHWDPFKLVAATIAGGIAVLLAHLALYPWPSIIPDLQDLHRQNAQQSHQEKKASEPSPFAP